MNNEQIDNAIGGYEINSMIDIEDRLHAANGLLRQALEALENAQATLIYSGWKTPVIKVETAITLIRQHLGEK